MREQSNDKRYRSRNKKNKRKQKIYPDSNQRQIHNFNSQNKSKGQWRRSVYHNQQKIIRDVCEIEVSPPLTFTICQNVEFIDPKSQKFVPATKIILRPPAKTLTKLDQLKDKITPIAKIWSSHVKQFLNDSQFVQIFRKGKSLAYGDVQYGKSIINYEQNKSNPLLKIKPQSKVFSRAYFKIWQILNMGIFNGIQNKNIMIASLAEGPGGFINALIDFRQKQHGQKDQYYSITLKISEDTRNAKDWSYYSANSYFEQMRRNGYKIKLSYGKTGTGDLLLQQNIRYFAQIELQNNKCYLVTADGGIECITDKQYHYQQAFNAKLFLSQIITALKIQQIGGVFILKIYDISFELTKQLIGLLCVFYESVKIVKPVTSRPGNSEKYVLCEGFVGIKIEQQQHLIQILNIWTKSQSNLSYFDNTRFLANIFNFTNVKNYQQIMNNLENVNQQFIQQQIVKLQQGFELVQFCQQDQQNIQQILRAKRYTEQINYAYSWCKKYGIPTIQTNKGGNQIGQRYA